MEGLKELMDLKVKSLDKVLMIGLQLQGVIILFGDFFEVFLTAHGRRVFPKLRRVLLLVLIKLVLAPV